MTDVVFLLASFFLGAAAVMVIFTVLVASANPRSGPDRRARSDGGEEAEIFCQFHSRGFETEAAAKDHAVEVHNAPREGEVWRETYGSAYPENGEGEP